MGGGVLWKMLTLADKGAKGRKANADIGGWRGEGVWLILTSLTKILKGKTN